MPILSVSSVWESTLFLLHKGGFFFYHAAQVGGILRAALCSHHDQMEDKISQQPLNLKEKCTQDTTLS